MMNSSLVSLQGYFSSSSDDDAFEMLESNRRSRRFRTRTNLQISDRATDTTQRFRLSDNDINFINQRIGSTLKHTTNRNHALSSEEQIRLALRYFSTGASFSVIGDAHGVHKSTVSRSVQRVVMHKISVILLEYHAYLDASMEHMYRSLSRMRTKINS
jgi:hypothetical protein